MITVPQMDVLEDLLTELGLGQLDGSFWVWCIDLKALGDLHVDVLLHWGLCEGQDEIQYLGVPFIEEVGTHQELGGAPAGHWSTCLVEILSCTCREPSMLRRALHFLMSPVIILHLHGICHTAGSSGNPFSTLDLWTTKNTPSQTGLRST